MASAPPWPGASFLPPFFPSHAAPHRTTAEEHPRDERVASEGERSRSQAQEKLLID